jgi:hypothetical protein
MGLAERRAAKAFQDNHAPALFAAIAAAAGSAVQIDVHWDKLAIDDAADSYEENWTEVYFKPLLEALQNVGRDDMGKEALAASLKQIVITNEQGIYYGDRWATFEDGVLTLDHEPNTNIHQTADRVEGVVSVLEKGL